MKDPVVIKAKGMSLLLMVLVLVKRGCAAPGIMDLTRPFHFVRFSLECMMA